MSVRKREAVLLVLLAVALPGAVVARTGRQALVIGNGSYATSPLVNPVRDARLIRDTLTADGFDVKYLENADRKQMLHAIQALGRALAEGGGDTVGVFYFSGHGVQYKDKNYLLPIGGSIFSDADLQSEAMDAAEVLAQMEQAHNSLDILILDACRNNPLPASHRDLTRGLRPMHAPDASLVAFATEAGGLASDGAGDHSPYAAALAYYMRRPGLELLQMFNSVAHRVYEVTNKAQTPVVTYKVTPMFYFREADGTDVPHQVDPHQADWDYWQAVQGLGRKGYEAYLRKYPDGEYSEVARLKLSNLSRPPVSGGGSASSSVSSQAAAVQPRPPAPDANRSVLQGAIDRKFVAWSSGWFLDHYVPGSVRLEGFTCDGNSCQATGHFGFTRAGSQHVISFAAAVQKAGQQYALGRLCYNDSTLNMSDCVN